MSQRFVFELRIEDSLTIDEIWPDGDAPENPTAVDVLRQLQATGSNTNVLDALSAWNLDVEAELTITKAGDWDDKVEW